VKIQVFRGKKKKYRYFFNSGVIDKTQEKPWLIFWAQTLKIRGLEIPLRGLGGGKYFFAFSQKSLHLFYFKRENKGPPRCKPGTSMGGDGG